MKIIFLKKKTIYILLTIVFIILLIGLINSLFNKADETFNRDIFYKGTKDEKVLAFACNVDWGNEYIIPMLDILKENNIKISFFVTGRWAEENEELLKKIYDNGHEIGNHGYSHRDYDKLNYENNKEEIEKAHNIIKESLGIDCKYFAPPSGAYNDNTVKAATDLDYDIIMWSVDTIDWREDSTRDVIIERVTSKAHNSAIVLMHPTEETLNALPILIEKLMIDGYNIDTINNILNWGDKYGNWNCK